MRGGAIAILAWATLNLVLFAGNAIWNSKAVSAAAAGTAVLIIYTLGIGVWLAGRDALRPGPPEPRSEVEAVPEASPGAVGAGLSVGCILFGLAWANFLVYFGFGALLVSLGRLVLEKRAERASVRSAEQRR